MMLGTAQYINLLPNAPTNLAASNETATTVDLAWDAVSQAGGYIIYQDGVEIAEVTTNSYQATGLTTATTYEFYVTAFSDDIYKVESDASNTVSVTTL